jgi:hypothetical protein
MIHGFLFGIGLILALILFPYLFEAAIWLLLFGVALIISTGVIVFAVHEPVGALVIAGMIIVFVTAVYFGGKRRYKLQLDQQLADLKKPGTHWDPINRKWVTTPYPIPGEAEWAPSAQAWETADRVAEFERELAEVFRAKKRERERAQAELAAARRAPSKSGGAS